MVFKFLRYGGPRYGGLTIYETDRRATYFCLIRGVIHFF